MDELIAFVEERLTDHELELRLNPGSDMFFRPLMGFIDGMRAVLADYRDMQEFAKAGNSTSDGKDWASGYMKGLEETIRRLAVHIWGVYMNHPGFKSEWEHGV